MAEKIRSIHRTYIAPVGNAFAVSIELNRRLWSRDFEAAWNNIGLTEKAIWLFFVANTICVFTLLEFVFLKIK